MTQAALKRTLQARPRDWTPLHRDVEVRFVEGFPRGHWSLVKGFKSSGGMFTNEGEATATTLADAVRKANALIEA